jgi:hypothetical protein
MSDIGPPPVSRNSLLFDRVKAILTTPKTEWPLIDAEPKTISAMYKSYVIPLAAIGPVAGLIGSLTFGYSIMDVTYRPTIGSALGVAVVGYVSALIGVYLLALVIEYLAPQFGAVKNRTQAFKIAAYGWTAAWVVGIFSLIPQLSFLTILGLYSLYLVYLGLLIVMKAPADRAMSYVAVVMVVAIVLSLILGLLIAPLARAFGPPAGIGIVRGGSRARGHRQSNAGSEQATRRGIGAPDRVTRFVARRFHTHQPRNCIGRSRWLRRIDR